MSAHILIVDDSKTQVQKMALDLRRAEYSVACAYDGIEALSSIMERPPDLIVLDYQMPKLDGHELIHLLRWKGLKCPIIMVTVHHSDELHIRCLKLGGNDYLTLPLDTGVFLAHIEARLQEHQDQNRKKTVEVLRFADVELHVQTHSVYRGPRTRITY